MKVQLNVYKKSDFPTLSNIVRKTWHYDEFCSPKTAARLSECFLTNSLASCSRAFVASVDGVPVGVICVRDARRKHFNLRMRLRKLAASISLLSTKEGRRTCKIFQSVSKIDDALLKNCLISFDCEICLLAVDEKSRGLGIGAQLFDVARKYVKGLGCNSLYLFTDTSCNWGFYEHEGMTREGEFQRSFLINGASRDMTFFIYSQSLKSV